MTSQLTIKQFLTADKTLTPLNGKIPINKNWNKEVCDEKEVLNHKGNIGWVLGSQDLVIDVDPRNGGDVSFEYLKKNLNIDLQPAVRTPRGGFHVYLKIPEKYQNKKLKKNIEPEYKGIDFLSVNHYCVIPTSSTEIGVYCWEDDIFGEFHQIEASEQLLSLLLIKNNNNSTDLGDFEELLDQQSYWSIEKIQEMLIKLDPSMGNDEWVKVGMALHNWDNEKGLELWENWSKDGDNYSPDQTEKRWKSFDNTGGVTLGTVNHMTKIVDFDETQEKVNTYINRIKYATEKILEFELVPEIKKENFCKLNKEKIAKSIQDRHKDLSDVKLPIQNIRNMLSNSDIVKGHFINDEDVPEWCADWIYVNTHMGFMNIKTLVLHKSEAFNVENGKYVPSSENGTKPSATKYISDRGFIEKADSIAYFPNNTNILCNIGGKKVLNSFNPRTIPVESKTFTSKGIDSIKIIKTHIKLLCTTDADSYIFTQWLAHQIQFPGKQILWSPVIQSIEGVGKSFFGELLRAVLGDVNVGVVSPGQVTSDNNGWAVGRIVNVLEELRVKGHNRYEAVNALKPLITDRMIQVTDKWVTSHMAYNTTNYICCTNYKDSLPLGENDRRWWVIFAQIESLKELKDYVGEDTKTYFPKLFSAVRNNGTEIRKWLLEYKITDEFLNTKQAPMTDHKQTMIATENASCEGLTEIKDLIEKGGKYYNKDIISSSDLFDAVLYDYPDLDFKTKQRNIVLKRLGYMALPSPMTIDGKTRRMWSKKVIDSKKVRQLLN